MTTQTPLRRKASLSPPVPAAKAKPPQSVAIAATAAEAPTVSVQELIDQLFEISCRASVCALAAEHLNHDDAPEVEKEDRKSVV